MAGAVDFQEGVFLPFFSFVAFVAFGIYAPAVGFFITKSSNLTMGVIDRGR